MATAPSLAAAIAARNAALIAARDAAIQAATAQRAALLARFSGSAGNVAAPQVATGSINVIRNVVYQIDSDHVERLDVYLPTGAVPAGGRPVVLAIHGGGWRKFSKEEYGPKVAPLTQMGFVVVVPDYTLSAPGRPSWPTNFEDVRQSVRWVRTNAAMLGADPNRIIAMGESSGGHLAALLGTYPDAPVSSDVPSVDPGVPQAPAPGTVSARVAGVIDFFGPADLTTFARDSGGAPAAAQMLGGAAPFLPERYAAASPATYVTPDDSPFLIVQGTADPVVSATQSQELAALLTAKGVPNRLVLIPGAGHGFGPFGPTTRELQQFLAPFA